MVTKYLGNVLINDSQVVTEKFLEECLENAKAMYSLLYSYATEEERAEYTTLLKLCNYDYKTVVREIRKAEIEKEVKKLLESKLKEINKELFKNL